ncbi:MAG: hypothetical protein KTR29_15220 [Rhodothermaceae bacterium]|nr:hypothetical protein [Rhodothermaceae bacterium]
MNEKTVDKSTRRMLMLTGWAGLIGAVAVGAGEFILQFSAEGGYEAADYGYFARVSESRLRIGHFLSVLAAPLYVVGYWHLGQMFIRGGSTLSGWVITLIGGYSFIVGTAWLGGRVYLALTVHEIADSAYDLKPRMLALLDAFSQHNEPLVDALRGAMMVVSVLWVMRIWGGHTLYPRWMAYFSPIVLLAVIFVIYFFVWPALGAWLLPAAMNVVHAVVFGLSLWVVYRGLNER